MATQFIVLTKEQENTLAFHAEKNSIEKPEMLQRIFNTAFAPYIAEITELKQEQIKGKYDSASASVKAQIDTLLGIS